MYKNRIVKEILWENSFGEVMSFYFWILEGFFGSARICEYILENLKTVNWKFLKDFSILQGEVSVLYTF